jgi:Tfp pilus assembly protein PilN
MRAVNLIPSDQRSGGSVGARSGGAVFLVLGLLAGLSVLALLYGSAHHKAESQRAEATTLAGRAKQVEAQAARLSPYTSFKALREQRLQAIAQLVGSRFDWPNAMGELSRVLPKDVAIDSLQGSVAAAAVTSSSEAAAAATATTGASSVSSATPPGATPTFTLSGCATDQAVVAQTLVRLRLIEGVSAVTLQSSTKGSSGAGGSGSGSCAGKDPVFTIQVSFDPLPTPAPTTTEATASRSASGRGSTASGASGASYVNPGSAR